MLLSGAAHPTDLRGKVVPETWRTVLYALLVKPQPNNPESQRWWRSGGANYATAAAATAATASTATMHQTLHLWSSQRRRKSTWRLPWRSTSTLGRVRRVQATSLPPPVRHRRRRRPAALWARLRDPP